MPFKSDISEYSDASAIHTSVIAKSDTVNEPWFFRGIYVGGTGNLVLVNLDDSTTLFSTIPAGTTLWVVGKRVNSTNTTATTMVALY